ncbi:hypothetical protein K2P97_08635 [bacterium]|nr:hypothetical protein [bacterium]
MKKFFKEAKVILAFFVILTVITILTNIDFSSDKIVLRKSMENMNNEIVNIKPSLLRGPASVVNEKDSLILSKEFLCDSAAPSVQEKVGKHLIMINFKICREYKSVREIFIENQSNGFKAQIFKLEANNFKTDYIQLNEGVNQLKLEVILKDGQKLAESLEILSGS